MSSRGDWDSGRPKEPPTELLSSLEAMATLMTMSDATLSEIERPSPAETETCVSMDEEAFRAFYERTARPVWAYLARLTGDPHAADDLLQEAFYRFYRAGAAHESEAHRRNSLFRQMRARRDAERAAARTVTIVQAVAIAAALAIALALLGAPSLAWLAQPGRTSWASVAPWGIPLMLAAALWLALAPVAVWLAVTED
jgi:Sigma-70 region 2